MSAKQEGPAGRKQDVGRPPTAKPPRPGSSLTDAVVAALAKVDEKDKPKSAGAAPPPPMAAEAGCAATTMSKDGAPPMVTAPAIAGNGSNGFRNGAGSFADLSRRWAGGPAMTPAPAAARPAPAPAKPPPPRPAAVEAQPTPPPKPVTMPASSAQPVQLHLFGRTDVGLVREHNEDNFLLADLSSGKRGQEVPRELTITERGCVFAVCDGMGGAAAGEVASQMAVDTIYEVFSRGEPPKDRDSFARRLVHAIEEAGHRIFSAAKMDRTRRGMGTTTTLGGLVDNVLFVGQVGDSRAYVLRKGHLEQITKDQSLVNQLIEAGQLTEEEAEAFEHSNIILQALGTTEEVTVDLTFLELRRGDRVLMCSDGLSGLVHADMIKEVLVTTPQLPDAAEKLIQMACAGGGHDNITVILADFDGEGLAAAGDAKVLYQQYPLPPDESRGHSHPQRETSMKSGGPKPGADVKRDDFAGVGAGEEVATQKSSKMGLLVAAALLVVLVVVVGGWFMFGSAISGTPETPTDAPAQHTQPVEQPVPPPTPVQDEPTPPTPPPAVAEGTVRVTTDVEPGATLFVNGEARGALHDGMELTLPPGAYTFEARNGETQIAREVVTLNGGDNASVALRVPAGGVEPPPAQQDTPSGQQATPRRERPRVRPTPTTPQTLQPQVRSFGGGTPSTGGSTGGGGVPQNPF